MVCAQSPPRHVCAPPPPPRRARIPQWEFIGNALAEQVYDNGLDTYLQENDAFVAAQVDAHPGDAFWHQAGLNRAQWLGLYAGYNAAATPVGQQLPWLTFYGATLTGDLDDLNKVFNTSGHRLHRDSALAKLRGLARDGSGRDPRPAEPSHCSVIVKPIGDPSSGAPTELFVSHTTWGMFETMTRIWKVYDLEYTVDGVSNITVPGRIVSFSSYPGALFSDDDWYQTSAGLTVTETTIANNNESLWAYVQPTTVLEWSRNTLANRLATDAASWTGAFAQWNSGTYNNMWHVVDWSKLTLSAGSWDAALGDGLLVTLEQMPGPYVIITDRTPSLRSTGALYWASYNR